MRVFRPALLGPGRPACSRRTRRDRDDPVSTPRPRWPVLPRRSLAGFEVSTEAVCSGCPLLVPVLVPVEGRSGEDSVERGRSRNLTQVRWRPRVSEDPRGDHSSPSNRLRTCRSALRVWRHAPRGLCPFRRIGFPSWRSPVRPPGHPLSNAVEPSSAAGVRRVPRATKESPHPSPSRRQNARGIYFQSHGTFLLIRTPLPPSPTPPPRSPGDQATFTT